MRAIRGRAPTPSAIDIPNTGKRAEGEIMYARNPESAMSEGSVRSIRFWQRPFPHSAAFGLRVLHKKGVPVTAHQFPLLCLESDKQLENGGQVARSVTRDLIDDRRDRRRCANDLGQEARGVNRLRAVRRRTAPALARYYETLAQC